MDQIKIGRFLKELRTGKQLTQESLAEKLGVSSKTVSRWETGCNMPDIGMLVELADFYGISITEIINGERKSENMNEEVRETAVKMAEYSKHEVRNGKSKAVSITIIVFGLFVIISAFAVFPSDSSWGSIYSILGSIFLLCGVFILTKTRTRKITVRLATVLGLALLLFGVFSLTDYVGVAAYGQVPRFSYLSSYTSNLPNQIRHETLFYTVIQENPGTKEERVYIVR
jgi:transcriptional regulator with XRE-family HTH domain